MTDLKNMSAELAAAEDSVQNDLDELNAAVANTGQSTADMYRLQQSMIKLDQLSEMNSAVLSAANTDLLRITNGVAE